MIPVEVGSLIWSEFPIRTYIEPSEEVQPNSAPSANKAIRAAIQDWTVYLPITVVEQPEAADIIIRRSPPPLRITPRQNPSEKPSLELERVRSAETRYTLYLRQVGDGPPMLSHRCIIFLNPRQTASYLQSAVRHELGHALGIWGHSPAPTDTMYFSQVRNPAAISPRDVNTLKRIYEQPTRLGWPLPSLDSQHTH
jgi:predicted Zn-dependent protease